VLFVFFRGYEFSSTALADDVWCANVTCIPVARGTSTPELCQPERKRRQMVFDYSSRSRRCSLTNRGFRPAKKEVSSHVHSTWQKD